MWLHVLRHKSRSVFSVSIDSGLLHSICLRVWVGSANESLELLPWVCLASSPGHSQILSRSNFLHGCEIKSGSGLGTRVCYSLLTIDSFCFIPSDDGTTLLPPLSQHTWLASCCPLHKTFSMVFVLVGKWYKPHCALTN